MSAKRKPRKPHVCDCPRCRGVKTADPRWGYDRAAVPAALCAFCDKKIGKEPYVLIITMARFGSMDVAHERCHPKGVKP